MRGSQTAAGLAPASGTLQRVLAHGRPRVPAATLNRVSPGMPLIRTEPARPRQNLRPPRGTGQLTAAKHIRNQKQMSLPAGAGKARKAKCERDGTANQLRRRGAGHSYPATGIIPAYAATFPCYLSRSQGCAWNTEIPARTA